MDFAHVLSPLLNETPLVVKRCAVPVPRHRYGVLRAYRGITGTSWGEGEKARRSPGIVRMYMCNRYSMHIRSTGDRDSPAGWARARFQLSKPVTERGGSTRGESR